MPSAFRTLARPDAHGLRVIELFQRRRRPEGDTCRSLVAHVMDSSGVDGMQAKPKVELIDGRMVMRSTASGMSGSKKLACGVAPRSERMTAMSDGVRRGERSHTSRNVVAA